MERVDKAYRDVLQKVLFARKAIHSGWFSDDEITILCDRLGFGDTAFREQKQEDKLNDFLLNTTYWLRRIPQLYEMEKSLKDPIDEKSIIYKDTIEEEEGNGKDS